MKNGFTLLAEAGALAGHGAASKGVRSFMSVDTSHVAAIVASDTEAESGCGSSMAVDVIMSGIAAKLTRIGLTFSRGGCGHRVIRV